MEGGKSCIKTFCWGGECSRTQVHVNVVVSKGRRLVLDGGRCATVVRHARTAFPLSLSPHNPFASNIRVSLSLHVRLRPGFYSGST